MHKFKQQILGSNWCQHMQQPRQQARGLIDF
jgi:hypothetical protein